MRDYITAECIVRNVGFLKNRQSDEMFTYNVCGIFSQSVHLKDKNSWVVIQRATLLLAEMAT